jgi:hypothetical protein
MLHDLRLIYNVSIYKLGRHAFDFRSPLHHQSNRFQISDSKFQGILIQTWNLKFLKFEIIN